MLQPLSESNVKKLFAGSTSSSEKPVGTRSAHPQHIRIQQGKEVFEYVKLRFDPSILEKAVVEGDLRLPYNFWEGFYRNVLNRVWSRAGQKKYKHALQLYLRALNLGATTVTGTMGGLQRKQKREFGGEQNALKCPELGELLYVFFIDCVQSLRCRVDGNFMMRHALFLKQRFLEKRF